VLEQLGVESTALSSHVGLAPHVFASADTRISGHDAGRLLHLCAERTGCRHFGLLVGKHAGLASLGFLWSLARHAPDVGTALHAINRFLHRNNSAAIATLSEHGALAVWSYAIYQPGLVGADQNCQTASAVACNTLRQLCGREWSPQEVLLPCSRPRDAQPFRSFYRAALVRFDADHLSVVFARSWLSHRIRGANPALHRSLMQQAVTMERKINTALPDIVRRVLRRLMLAGRASIEEVAAILSVHRRTLDRRLDAHGITFRDLAEEVGFAVSQQLLRDTEMSISDVANALHYAHQGAFASAFRRWAGVTPSEWRARAWALSERRGTQHRKSR
jgi:AraC-like DNA-binding protein